jgi:hypothetical protein
MAADDVKRSMRVPGEAGASPRSDHDSSGAIPKFREVAKPKVTIPTQDDVVYDPAKGA